MKSFFLLSLFLISFSSARWIPYDYSVTNPDRANIYIDCAFSTQYMMNTYYKTYWNNPQAFLDVIVDFLKSNFLFVILTPYITNAN